MKPLKQFNVLIAVLLSFISFSQNGSISNPFTSLGQSANVTSAGTYFFNIGNQSFSSFVDNNGFMLVAIDYGNASGTLPTYSNLATNTRGVLNPAVLLNLDFFDQVKVTGPRINYVTNNQLNANRIRHFKPLMRGNSDFTNGIDWTNNGGSITTQFSSNCVGALPAGVTHTDSVKLSQVILHACGNVNGIHWMPSFGNVREVHSNGNIAASNTLRIWIKRTCAPPTDPGFGINSWNMNGYSFDEINPTSDFNDLSILPTSPKFINYGHYTTNSVSVNTLNNWGISSNPSSASSWTGCTLKNDNFVLRGRRKGFPLGFYKISLPYNDDGIKIYLNGSEIYSFIDCCTDKGVIFQGALCSTSELEFRMIEYSGGSRLDLKIESIPWPVDAGSNATVIGNTTNSIGTVLNSANASLLTSNTWTSSSVSSIGSTVPTSVIPSETTTYTLTSVSNGCTYTDQVTLEVFEFLPVELLSFDVYCIEENKKEISWSTASERNSAYFSIEKSSNGIDWNEINNVEAAGNSLSTIVYSIKDNSSDDNTVYYRLNQVDKDGNSKLYDAQSVVCLEDETIRIYPNPTTDGKFTLSKDIEYTIFDSVGNKINAIEKSGVYLILIDGKLFKLINL